MASPIIQTTIRLLQGLGFLREWLPPDSLLFPTEEWAAEEWDEVVRYHPASSALKQVIEDAKPPSNDWQVSEVRRENYLECVAGEVDFWKAHQNDSGAIVDPFEKAERQYSTPAYALAASSLVDSTGRDDLLDSATRALSHAVRALASGTTANQHPDFYIPLVMHARRRLRPRVSAAVSDEWDAGLRSLSPHRHYRDTRGWGNWSLVNAAGELMRRREGLVAEGRSDEQKKYLDSTFSAQKRRMTRFGLYYDLDGPLAYDAFPRMWLADALVDSDYQGEHRRFLDRFLAIGEASTLLMLSPSGEWPAGGRSGHHQWNEAQIVLIAEIAATRWKKSGREDVARIFKRAAHLAFQSMLRWRRSDGPMWIVKNRRHPGERMGYLRYSFFSQYNLLPAAMLAMAHARADETIAESSVPAERSHYIFDLREPFHKVVAARDGYYLELDTAADPHYESTGLLRVHRAGVALSPLTSSPAESPRYGRGGAVARGISPGIEWKKNGTWCGLARYSQPRLVQILPAQEKVAVLRGAKRVTATSLEFSDEKRQTRLRLSYRLSGAEAITEEYTLSEKGVTATSRLEGAPEEARIVFPALVSDGETPFAVTLDGPCLRIDKDGGALAMQILEPAGVVLQREDRPIASPNGIVNLVFGMLPRGSSQVTWHLTVGAPSAIPPSR